MKQVVNGVDRHNRKPFVLNFWSATLPLILFAVAISGCQKQMKETMTEVQSMNAKNTQADVLKSYSGLLDQTNWELQQARAATARYRNFDNTIKDGYSDIEVLV